MLSNGTVEETSGFLDDRGIEILKFVAQFIDDNDIPEIQPDGVSGGVTLVGWSLGNPFTLAAIANIDSVDEGAQATLSSHLKGLILQGPFDGSPLCALRCLIQQYTEASGNTLGFAPHPQFWLPLFDESLPTDTRIPLFAQFATAYFNHSDITSKDPSILNWNVPSIFRAPGIFNFSQDDYESIIEDDAHTQLDGVFLGSVQPARILEVYRKAVFDKGILEYLPHLKVLLIAGTTSNAFALELAWLVEADNEQLGQERTIQIELIPDVNHLVSTFNNYTPIRVLTPYLA